MASGFSRKKSLSTTVLQQAAAVPQAWIARGQCLEQYGAGEAYLPVLDALSRLGRASRGERVVDVLRRHAPAWLLELPSLLAAADRAELRQQVGGATRERMLREMAEARLMVIGTYRPVDVILVDHPLKSVKRELQAHGLCHDLPLEYLTEDAVGQYLAGTFPRHALPKRLARLIHQRTEGNPLFMVNLVEYLVAEAFIFRYFRAELNAAFAIAEQLLALARELPDDFVTIEAHRACGVTLVDLGRFEEAMTHLEAVSALYETGRQYPHVSLAGQDPNVTAECYAARALWALGHPDQALARVEHAVSLAHVLAHGETLVIATHLAAHIHQLRGEASSTQERAETVIALADEYGLELWSAFGHIYRGCAVVEQGQAGEGLEELQRGLAAYDATGARLWRGHSLGLLARALARAGRIEDARGTVAEALALVQQTGEHGSRRGTAAPQGRVVEDAPGRSSSAYCRSVRSSLITMNSFGSGCPGTRPLLNG